MSAAELTVVLWTQSERAGSAGHLSFQPHSQFWNRIQYLGKAEAILASPRPLLLRNNNTPHKGRVYPLFPHPVPDSLWLILPSSLPLSHLQTDTALHSLSSRKLSWIN